MLWHVVWWEREYNQIVNILLKLQDVVKLTIGLILEIDWIVWDHIFINILIWIIIFYEKSFVLIYICCVYKCGFGKDVDFKLNPFVMLYVSK